MKLQVIHFIHDTFHTSTFSEQSLIQSMPVNIQTDKEYIKFFLKVAGIGEGQRFSYIQGDSSVQV